MTKVQEIQKKLCMEEQGMAFTDAVWHEIVEHLAVSFNLDAEMREKLEAKNTARLIGAIPFIGECDHPFKTAVQHVAIYILSIQEGTKQYFHHTQADDVSLGSRLQPIMQFSGGNPVLLTRGMNLLMLQMVAGYLRDVEKDMKNTKYNPVAAGVWNAEELIERLSQEIESVPHVEMDSIMTVGESIRGYWSL